MGKKSVKFPIALDGKIILSNIGRTSLNEDILKPYESILIKKEALK